MGAGSHIHGTDSILIEACSNAQHLDANFSALLVSKSVRELQVDIKEANAWKKDLRQRLWRWIALVFFSGHAANDIQKMTLDVTILEKGDVEMIERLLHAPDPLSLIFGAQLANRVVTASNFCLVDPQREPPGAADPTSTIVFATPLKDLRVLDEQSIESEWINVLLPGWGRAWVASSNAEIKERPLCDGPAVRPNRLLALRCAKDKNGVATSAFLRLAALHVQTLCLQACHYSGTTVRQILDVCPHVEEVKIQGHPHSYLHCIASAYEEGHCRAQRLYLNVQKLLNEDDADIFFDCLADNRHPMSRCVRVLHFTFHARGTLPGVRAAVLRMLQQNHRLQELKVSVESVLEGHEGEMEEQKRVQADCNGFDGNPAIAPLGLDKKLAFLSVVHSAGYENSTQAATAIRSLDSNVLAAVFEFAAGSPSRFIQIKFGLFRYAED